MQRQKFQVWSIGGDDFIAKQSSNMNQNV